MPVAEIGKVSQQSSRKLEGLLGTVMKQLKVALPFHMGDVTESDPLDISWENKEKGLKEFCLFIKKELYPILEPLFKVGHNASYKGDTILDVLMYMATHGVTSENGSKGFKHEYEEGPSARTTRRRLENLEFSDIEKAFFKANEKILSFFREKRRFKKIFYLLKKGKKLKLSVLISVDKSDNPCHGKRRKYACGMKRKKGTNYGYRYASVAVSVAGINVTLCTMPMTEFTTNPEMLSKINNRGKKVR